MESYTRKFIQMIFLHSQINATMKKYTYTDKKDTRSGFGEGMKRLGQSHPNVVALCADLAGSLKLGDFIKAHPERYVQVGIAEASTLR